MASVSTDVNAAASQNQRRNRRITRYRRLVAREIVWAMVSKARLLEQRVEQPIMILFGLRNGQQLATRGQAKGLMAHRKGGGLSFRFLRPDRTGDKQHLAARRKHLPQVVEDACRQRCQLRRVALAAQP